MSAPTRIASTSATRTAATPAPARRRNAGGDRSRSAAIQRAYARRVQRTGRVLGGSERVAEAAGRTQFVVLVMVLAAGALIATLWLSTAAAADSYGLQASQERARDLQERSEQLSRDVALMETAPEVARRALELGLIPVSDPAHLIVGPDGRVTLVGEPTRAAVPAPPDAPVAPAAPAPPAAAFVEPPVPPVGAAPPADPNTPPADAAAPAPAPPPADAPPAGAVPPGDAAPPADAAPPVDAVPPVDPNAPGGT